MDAVRNLPGVALDLEDVVAEELRRGPSALVVPETHRLAAPLVEAESLIFPEAPALFDGVDQAGMFHFLVIVVESEARSVMRMSGPGPLAGTDGVLPFFVTNLVAGGQITLADLDTYYALSQMRMERMISIETLFRLGPQLDGLDAAGLCYLALFAVGFGREADGVLAHLNAASIRSLDRVGVRWHRLAGREDLGTPTVAEVGGLTFDPDYFPICIPRRDPDNEQLVEDMAPVTPALHYLERELEVEIDLTEPAVDLRERGVERTEL
jgi:hypothetical protein